MYDTLSDDEEEGDDDEHDADEGLDQYDSLLSNASMKDDAFRGVEEVEDEEEEKLGKEKDDKPITMNSEYEQEEESSNDTIQQENTIDQVRDTQTYTSTNSDFNMQSRRKRILSPDNDPSREESDEQSTTSIIVEVVEVQLSQVETEASLNITMDDHHTMNDNINNIEYDMIQKTHTERSRKRRGHARYSLSQSDAKNVDFESLSTTTNTKPELQITEWGGE